MITLIKNKINTRVHCYKNLLTTGQQFTNLKIFRQKHNPQDRYANVSGRCPLCTMVQFAWDQGWICLVGDHMTSAMHTMGAHEVFEFSVVTFLRVQLKLITCFFSLILIIK